MIAWSGTWRGLEIEATFSTPVPATWEDPPEGGDLERLEWWVEDIDEVLLHLELSTESLDQMVRTLWRTTGKLPRVLVDKIGGWDIEDAAQEMFWEDHP